MAAATTVARQIGVGGRHFLPPGAPVVPCGRALGVMLRARTPRELSHALKFCGVGPRL